MAEIGRFADMRDAERLVRIPYLEAQPATSVIAPEHAVFLRMTWG